MKPGMTIISAASIASSGVLSDTPAAVMLAPSKLRSPEGRSPLASTSRAPCNVHLMNALQRTTARSQHRNSTSLTGNARVSSSFLNYSHSCAISVLGLTETALVCHHTAGQVVYTIYQLYHLRVILSTASTETVVTRLDTLGRAQGPRAGAS